MRTNIEAERARLLMSKEKLSKQLGISSKTYSSYVSGNTIPSDILLKMSDLFNCSVDYLLGLTDKTGKSA